MNYLHIVDAVTNYAFPEALPIFLVLIPIFFSLANDECLGNEDWIFFGPVLIIEDLKLYSLFRIRIYGQCNHTAGRKLLSDDKSQWWDRWKSCCIHSKKYSLNTNKKSMVYIKSGLDFCPVYGFNGVYKTVLMIRSFF